ncbi:putative phage tail fiber assembly protein [Yersinia frederiksenii]|uniref:tail fiber assembly protein n=1 Tax=Yersinia enterocolitica TaxID=630 RepID=UPI0005E0CCEA|nr:tail fiber assembly protein [Yersinia enterocolitica]CNI37633.1 putative phage tail fiber assembly protein [Yersinia frederiksenii]
MKLNQLDEKGFFIVDHVEGNLPDNWTADLVGDGYYKAQYQNGSRNPETGEWTGGKWVETSGPSAEDIESVKESLIAAANTEKTYLMSHASDMIAAISDEIEILEDSDNAVPNKLRSDLKAWKQYRIALKNIDVSAAPDIEWPVAPE